MAGKIVRTDIIEHMSNKIYASDSILTDSIIRDVDHSLCESLGISREVEKESQRIKDIILAKWKNVEPYTPENGIGVYKFGFHDTLFSEDYYFSISLVNYRFYEIWKERHKKYMPKVRAGIDKDKHIMVINIDAIDMDITTQTFESSIQHEIQHYFETEMSSYTWATNDVYKLAKELLNDQNEYVYLIGVILYMSFKQEQEGYANGLYAFLKNCGQKVTRKNIDELSEAEESFSMLRLLKMSKNYLLGIPAKSQEMIDAIDTVNLSYGTKYTAENLYDMANKIYKDFIRRLNRVKSLILFPNEMYEANIKRLLCAAPFLVKNGKIISG